VEQRQKRSYAFLIVDSPIDFMIGCLWDKSLSRKRRIIVIAASYAKRIPWQTDLTDEIA
jgi:hypothetical protein